MDRLIPTVHSYFDYRIVIEPVRPGKVRWRVYHMRGSLVLANAVLVCDYTAPTKLSAWMRARDLVRRRRRRQARWPENGR